MLPTTGHLQRAITKFLLPRCIHFYVSSVLRQRLARRFPDDINEVVTACVYNVNVLLRHRAGPIQADYWRLLCNGICVGGRFGQTFSCPICNDDAATDTIRHFVQCPVLLRLLQARRPELAHSRFLYGLSNDIGDRILAFQVLHALNRTHAAQRERRSRGDPCHSRPGDILVRELQRTRTRERSSIQRLDHLLQRWR